MSRTFRRKNGHGKHFYIEGLQEYKDLSLKQSNATYHSDAYSDGSLNECPSWFKQLLRRNYRKQCKRLLKNAKITNNYENIIFPRDYKTALWEWW